MYSDSIYFGKLLNTEQRLAFFPGIMANLNHSKNIKLDKFTGINYKRWANQMKY